MHGVKNRYSVLFTENIEKRQYASALSTEVVLLTTDMILIVWKAGTVRAMRKMYVTFDSFLMVRTSLGQNRPNLHTNNPFKSDHRFSARTFYSDIHAN